MQLPNTDPGKNKTKVVPPLDGLQPLLPLAWEKRVKAVLKNSSHAAQSVGNAQKFLSRPDFEELAQLLLQNPGQFLRDFFNLCDAAMKDHLRVSLSGQVKQDRILVVKALLKKKFPHVTNEIQVLELVGCVFMVLGARKDPERILVAARPSNAACYLMR